MGISINRKLCDRIHILQEWILIIQEIKAEIVFQAASVTSIFDRFAKRKNSFTANFFKSICEDLTVFGVQTAAEHSMAELKKLPLTENDLNEILHVFDAIGRYDAFTQAEALEKASLRLEYQLADARLQQGQKGKLYQTIGFSCGIALALILV